MSVNPEFNLNLVFHHTGLLVKNIEDSVLYYKTIFGEKSASIIYEIESQKVKVCFITIGIDCYLELVEPFEGHSNFNTMFKRGIAYYHNGYTTTTFDETLESLLGKDFRILSTFNSEAFDGKRCSFLISKKMHLFELIEK
jgi:catechol 2,3-dioxygenase-like lactoylglutathione lyase family enzyme